MTKRAVKWKEFDACMQIIAFVVPVLISIITVSGAALFLLYFAIGGVQLISAIVHVLQGRSPAADGWRRKYNITLLVLIIITIIVAATPFILIMGVIVLLLTPLMAINYFYITLVEWNRMKRILEEETAMAHALHAAE